MSVSDCVLTAFGLLTFAAAAQFGPALVCGILWRRGNYTGAVWGLGLGFLIWCYTLLLPALAATGWTSAGFIENGLFGWHWARPTALFGSELDQTRSEEHTSELQSRPHLVCRLLLEKKNIFTIIHLEI